MESDTKESAKRTAKGVSYKSRFDSKKELRLTGLTHQFLKRDEPYWNLLFEKLSVLQDTYKEMLAFKLCRRCLSFCNCNKKARHEEITIKSLFKLIDFKHQTVSDLLSLLKEHGRVIRDFKGEELIGFPGFNLECSDDYYFASDQVPVQPELQEYSFQSISFSSMTHSEGNELAKRHLSSCATEEGTSKGTWKMKNNTDKSPVKRNWIPAGRSSVSKQAEHTTKSANKQDRRKP
jgi:hypothetical protein